MSGQVSVMAEASLPAPPSTKEFFARLEALANPPPGTKPADTALFGNTFSVDPGNHHTHKNFMTAMNAVASFSKVLSPKGLVLDNLDEWLTALSKSILPADALFDTAEEKANCLQQRQELCDAAGIEIRGWCPTTLKTAVNVLALKYRETSPTVGIATSSMKQFPN
jgi:hypothetical protein